MTEPVAPWSEYARSEWARLGDRWLAGEQHAITEAAWNRALADELRAPDTDEEPWDVLDAAIVGTAWWATAVAAVLGLLLLVLAALGIRKAVRP